MFTTLDKVWFGFCGLLVASVLIWLTHTYFEYRVVMMQKVDYSNIPTWSWKPIFNKIGGHDG
tara:strand:- start:413 stop:598 length:186 start_codon:yes stop_codon:yes gene_type:complete